MNRSAIALQLALSSLIFCVTLNAAPTTRADYQTRLREAAQLARAAAEAEGVTSAASAKDYERLAQLLPVTEDVTDDEQLIHVNNGLLHEALAPLDEDDETRAEQWATLADYLDALNARVNDLGTPLPTDFKLERAKLDTILARSEYKTDERQASGIQQWLKQMWQRFKQWLSALFATPDRAPSMPGRTTVNLARVIIISLLAAALLYALVKLWQWWRRRSPKQQTEGTREILGVEITEETTTEDLLAAARALAQQGDYRGAIRRSYLALLYELEQRGQLRLHRAKTNRDYLNALRHEAALYPMFAALTHNFEQVWYGQTRATNLDFEGFLKGYQSAVSSSQSTAGSYSSQTATAD